MRIAILSDGMWPLKIGGMQMHTYQMVRYLLRRGIQVDLYHPMIPSLEAHFYTEHFTEQEKKLLEIIKVEWPVTLYFPGHYLFRSYQYSKKIAEHLATRVKSYDLIYIQGFSGWLLATSNFFKQRINVPLIVNFHGLEMFQLPVSRMQSFQFLFFRHFVRSIMRGADAVQSLGGRLTEIIAEAGIDRERIFCCSNGVEESWLREEPLTLAKNKNSFLFIGRYEKRKGLKRLIEAVSDLDNTSAGVQLTIIGPVPERVARNSDIVTFLGAISDRRRIMEEIDRHNFLIMPSLSEGMPTVALEAMARGCIVVGTEVGALNAIMEHSNSIVIESADHSGIAKAIGKALRLEPERMLEMKRSAVKTVREGYTWERISDCMVRQFECLISQKGRI